MMVLLCAGAVGLCLWAWLFGRSVAADVRADQALTTDLADLERKRVLAADIERLERECGIGNPTGRSPRPPPPFQFRYTEDNYTQQMLDELDLEDDECDEDFL